MPTLDVTEVLDDPDIADTFTVTRRVQTVSSLGRTVVTPTVVAGVVGVVCAAGPNDLQRLPEDQRMGKVISIVTRYKLRGPALSGSTEYQPDLVIWNGSTFIVKWVDDYSRFASGFIQALAGSLQNVDPPPP